MDCAFFASFGESLWLGASEEFWNLGRVRENFLSLTTLFEWSDMDLLGSRGDW